MLAAFVLGLFGSVGHCSGMCSGVALLLGRSSGAAGWRVLLLHLGRVTSYGLMGLVAGGLGRAMAGMGGDHGIALPGFSFVQGALALIAAGLAVYMAIAFLGRAPSPELFLSRVTRWWGRTMRKLTISPPAPNLGGGQLSHHRHRRAMSAKRSPQSWGARGADALRGLASTYALGLLWGLLPCGLVLMALLLAAVAGSAQRGAVTMIVFGLGTWPLVLGVTLAPRLQLLQRNVAPWVRPATAAIILIFGLQMALRGLAAWGLVDHLYMGGLALW